MDDLVLFRIQKLQARVVKEEGFAFRFRGRTLTSGTVAAVLDETEESPANFGYVNAKSGAIYLRWSIVATLPVLADALLAGELSESESGAVRVAFEEAGKVLAGGVGFDAEGAGRVAPGSLLDGVEILPHTNYVRVLPEGKRKRKPANLVDALAKGKSVRCALLPESTLVARLPKSLGGGIHHLNLLGGFTLVPEPTRLGRAGARRKTR